MLNLETLDDIRKLVKTMSKYGVTQISIGDVCINMPLKKSDPVLYKAAPNRLFYTSPITNPSISDHPQVKLSTATNTAAEKLRKTASTYRDWASMKPPATESGND